MEERGTRGRGDRRGIGARNVWKWRREYSVNFNAEIEHVYYCELDILSFSYLILSSIFYFVFYLHSISKIAPSIQFHNRPEKMSSFLSISPKASPQTSSSTSISISGSKTKSTSKIDLNHPNFSFYSAPSSQLLSADSSMNPFLDSGKEIFEQIVLKLPYGLIDEQEIYNDNVTIEVDEITPFNLNVEKYLSKYENDTVNMNSNYQINRQNSNQNHVYYDTPISNNNNKENTTRSKTLTRSLSTRSEIRLHRQVSERRNKYQKNNQNEEIDEQAKIDFFKEEEGRIKKLRKEARHFYNEAFRNAKGIKEIEIDPDEYNLYKKFRSERKERKTNVLKSRKEKENRQNLDTIPSEISRIAIGIGKNTTPTPTTTPTITAKSAVEKEGEESINLLLEEFEKLSSYDHHTSHTMTYDDRKKERETGLNNYNYNPFTAMATTTTTQGIFELHNSPLFKDTSSDDSGEDSSENNSKDLINDNNEEEKELIKSWKFYIGPLRRYKEQQSRQGKLKLARAESFSSNSSFFSSSSSSSSYSSSDTPSLDDDMDVDY